jgi:hypothetical protein
MKAQFSQKMTGERKAVMQGVAAATGAGVRYQGAPSFAYEAGCWHIDRAGVLTSPVFDMGGGGPAFSAGLMGDLGKRGFAAEGVLSVTIFPDEYDPAHLQNIRAILSGKATLLQHALGIDKRPDAALAVGDALTNPGPGGGFVFPFYPPGVTAEGILAALQFSKCVYFQAAAQERVRTKDALVENEKYAMRCFLLRIGMIGDAYAATRKELLRRLSGNSSFKTAPPREAPGGNCLSRGASLSEPGDSGPDRLFCATRQRYILEDGARGDFNS